MTLYKILSIAKLCVVFANTGIQYKFIWDNSSQVRPGQLADWLVAWQSDWKFGYEMLPLKMDGQWWSNFFYDLIAWQTIKYTHTNMQKMYDFPIIGDKITIIVCLVLISLNKNVSNSAKTWLVHVYVVNVTVQHGKRVWDLTTKRRNPFLDQI